MREGRDLETLVATLEKAASADPNLSIQSPYFATDRVTKSKREHDVGIIIKQDHHEIIIALECRDRSRSVTVPEVEAFALKCQDTGVHKGCIVSSKGFAEDALTKASHLSIGCYTLQEAQDLSWIQAGDMSAYSSKILSNNWLFIPQTNPETKPEHFHIEAPDGTTVDQIHMKASVHAEVSKKHSTQIPQEGIHQYLIRFLMDGYSIVDDDTGAKYPVKHANVTAEVEVTRQPVPITKYIYRDAIKDTHVIEAGVAPISGAGISGDLLFVSGAKGINVSFRPHG